MEQQTSDQKGPVHTGKQVVFRLLIFMAVIIAIILVFKLVMG